MGPIRNPRWEQKRTEGYVIVSTNIITIHFDFWTVSDKIAATVIIGFIVVKITQFLIFILKLQI